MSVGRVGVSGDLTGQRPLRRQNLDDREDDDERPAASLVCRDRRLTCGLPC